MIFNLKQLNILSFTLAVLLTLLNILFRPYLLENQSFSRAVFDRNKKLLKLTLNSDEKYKIFVPLEKIPKEFRKSVLIYEDKFFYYHFGFNPFSLIRASFSLFGGRKLGASTITMQVVRMNYGLNTKTILGKVWQIIKAIQIESFYTKDEILEAYFNLAPYGHNIEGSGAASLIYFGTPVEKLSLSEILALTAIPQNPTKRVPTNPEGFNEMMTARQRLAKIYFNGEDSLLPIKVGWNLPSRAMHLVREMLLKSDRNEIITTIDYNLQEQIESQINSYVRQKSKYGVKNAAVLLVNANNMEVVATIGSRNFFDDSIQGQVNGVKALRSPGSALKPFIYGLALDQGLIHSKTILKDVPKSFGAYNPENSDRQFMGVVPADLALVYSRNVPAVDLLKKLDKSSFYNLLIKGGANLREEDYYGLALALGGYEISMENVAKLYASLLNKGIVKPLKKEIKNYQTTETRILSPEASFIVIKMLEKNQPLNGYSSLLTPKSDVKNIAWKTGTSFGYKDAWAVGLIPPYVLVVWIGNFNGDGNNAFKGREMAGGLFFNIAEILLKNDANVKKYKLHSIGLNVKEIDVCSATGDLKTDLCPKTEKAWFIPMVSPIKSSNVFRKIPINIATGKRACRSNPPYTRDEVYEFWASDLENAKKMVGIYLKKPPEFEEDCGLEIKQSATKPPKIITPAQHLIYYRQDDKLLPLKASADTNISKLFWFMDKKYIGESKPNEVLFVKPVLGRHTVMTVDENGNSDYVSMEVRMIKN